MKNITDETIYELIKESIDGDFGKYTIKELMEWSYRLGFDLGREAANKPISDPKHEDSDDRALAKIRPIVWLKPRTSRDP